MNEEKVCDVKFKYVEEKISDIKIELRDQKDIIKDLTKVLDEVAENNDELKIIVSSLKEKSDKLENSVTELNKAANTLSVMAKFAKPLVFAIMAALLSSIPGGLEIIKLLAGMF